MVKLKKFNISASMLKVYRQSPLQFYYQYLSNEKPSDKVVESYSQAGNILHSCVELFIKTRDEEDALEKFSEMWYEQRIEQLKTLNGRPLSFGQYEMALQRAMTLVKHHYNPLETEMEIILPSHREGHLFKGFLDLVAEYKGERIVVDWKTSSSLDNFKESALMYVWLYYKKTGIFINKAYYEYVKIGEQEIYSFTDEEIIEFGETLKNTLDEIYLLGNNIKNYDVGSYDNPFNRFKSLCIQEAMNRYQKDTIRALRRNNKLYFTHQMPEKLKKFLKHYFRYPKPNYRFTKLFERFGWNEKYMFEYKYKTDHIEGCDYVPYPYVNKVREIIEAYNKKYGEKYQLRITDTRVDSIVNKVYDTEFKKSEKTLRPYQEEADQIILDKKFCIINVCTGGGKSIISAEFVKRVNRRTIIVCNKIELGKQLQAEYEDYLGVKVGLLMEGKLDVKNQITVCSIQTLMAILKRGNQDTKDLIRFLYNVTVAIFDESHNYSDEQVYSTVADHIPNVEYCVGLSATNFRADGSTLSMNSLVGFTEYSITTHQLVELGFLSPIKTKFYKTKKKTDTISKDYNVDYQTFIIDNEERNKKIVSLAEQMHNDNKKTVIVVSRIAHGELLESMLPNSFFLNGSTPKELRFKKFQEFKNTKNLIMISMNKIFGEGISIDDLEVMINASAHKSDIDTVQLQGRVMRQHKDKEYGIYIDFLDSSPFDKASKERMKKLQEVGQEVQVVE